MVMFQMMMNDIFRELIDKGVVVHVYILICGSETQEQHHPIVVWVLAVLHNYQLYLKVNKCTFGQPTVEYLGLSLLDGCMEMDPVKLVFTTGQP